MEQRCSTGSYKTWKIYYEIRMLPIAVIPRNCFSENLLGYKGMETT